ncbi:MAG: AsmA family protein [gamma proteobacterium endosymbiont of Lamellibrachia anaximandri]|nr:AsmA family protein [gamma proteobacterium endosymbiont of Lamellibrachia anaximandri]MBL3532649.1 AsmA family protein [gamma proteobacterium endosymbiont of Lamellibrachia anaximandri]
MVEVKRVWRWSAGVAVTLLLLVMGLMLTASYWLNANRDILAAGFSETLGREVSLNGELALGLSLYPTLVAENISIANPAWASRANLLELKRLELQLTLLPLLNGELLVKRLLLQGADLMLESTEKQGGNWVFAAGKETDASADSSEMQLPVIDKLQLEELRLGYRVGGTTPNILRVKRAEASLSATGELQATAGFDYHSVDLSGRFNGLISAAGIFNARLDLTTEQSELHAELKGDQVTWEVTANSSDELSQMIGAYLPKGTSAELQGASRLTDSGLQFLDLKGWLRNIYGLDEFTVADGSVKVTGGRVEVDLNGPLEQRETRLQFSLGEGKQTFAEAESWPLEAGVQTESDRLMVSGEIIPGEKTVTRLTIGLEGKELSHLPMLKGKLRKTGAFQIDGQMSAEGTQVATRIQGGLQARRLDLAPFISPKQKPQKVQSGAKKVPQESLLDMPLEVSWPESLSLDLTLSAKQVDGLNLPLQKVKGRLQMSGQTLGIEGLQLRVDGLPIRGGLQMKNGESLTFDLNSSSIKLENIAFRLGLKGNLRGELKQTRMRFVGNGRTLGELLAQGELRVETSTGHIVFGKADGSSPLDLALSRLQFASLNGKNVTLNAEGKLRSESFNLQVTGPELTALVQGKPSLPVSTKLTLGKTEGALSLHLDGASGKLKGPLSFLIHCPSLQTLSKLTGVTLPETLAYRVEGEATALKERVVFSKLRAEAGKSRIVGDLQIRLQGDRPDIRGELRAEVIDLTDLQPFFAGEAQPQEGLSKSDWLFSEHSMSLSVLIHFDMNLQLKFPKLAHGSTPVGSMHASVGLSAGELHLNSIVLKLDSGGSLNATASANAATTPPQLALQLKVSGFDYGVLLERLDVTQDVDGSADFAMDISGSGWSLREVAAGLDGHLVLVGGEGRIKNQDLPFKLKDFVGTLLPQMGLKDEPVVDLNCLVDRLDFSKGVGYTRSMLIDTKKLTIAGAGEIDLRDETLHMILNPRPKELTLISLTNPVKLEGRLHAPSIKPTKLGTLKTIAGVAAGVANPAYLLLAFGDVGVSEENPCLAAIQQTEVAAKVKQGVGGLTVEVEADLTNQLDRFGRTIKKVFSPVEKILGLEQKQKDESKGEEKPQVITPLLDFE